MSSKWAAEKMSSGISQSAHVSNEHCSAHFRISNILMRNEMFGLKKWKLPFFANMLTQRWLQPTYIYCVHISFTRTNWNSRVTPVVVGAAPEGGSCQRSSPRFCWTSLSKDIPAVIFPPLRSCHMPRERFLETRWVFNWVFLHPREKDPGAPTT